MDCSNVNKHRQKKVFLFDIYLCFNYYSKQMLNLEVNCMTLVLLGTHFPPLKANSNIRVIQT